MELTRDNPLVSVIIPSFNSADYIQAAISSVEYQDYPNREIIVIDDGSTDGTAEILRKSFPHLKTLRIPNSGVSAARNRGIIESKGELIAFLDSDDVWLQQKLSRQIEVMKSRDADLVYCSGVEFDDSNSEIRFIKAQFHGRCYRDYRANPTTDITAVGPSGVLLKRNLIHKAGLFDCSVPAPTEDWDFFRRCSMHGVFAFSAEVLVKKRIHKSNASRRSLASYYQGNEVAVRKMFAEDRQINYSERLVIRWKLLVNILKSGIKYRDIRMSAKMIICIIKIPIDAA